MKKLLLMGFLPVLIATSLNAQESAGFSDPDNIQPLLDYRLPAWGYSNLLWDFSMAGDFRTHNSEIADHSLTHNQFTGHLMPAYTLYRESEPRVSSYSIRPQIDYSVRSRSSFINDENYQNSLALGLNWNLNEKFYRNDSDLFFTGDFSGGLQQVRDRIEQSDVMTTIADEIIINRNFNPALSIGIGYGRLRNVNPMIRALRMNERLDALNSGQSLSQGDLFQAADQFSRSNGYAQIYDRPEKIFWGDMDGLLSANLSALDPFDLLYLTETTTEAIASRREGWQVQATLGLQYLINYIRVEDQITPEETESRINSTPLFNPAAEVAWFRNLSLNHQVGLTGNFQYRKVLNEDNELDIGIFNTSAFWLYTITDRILIQNSLSYSRSSTPVYSSDFFLARLNINYFIENSFSLFASLSFRYNPNQQISSSNGIVINTIGERSFAFNAGVRYYMRRGMF